MTPYEFGKIAADPRAMEMRDGGPYYAGAIDRRNAIDDIAEQVNRPGETFQGRPAIVPAAVPAALSAGVARQAIPRLQSVKPTTYHIPPADGRYVNSNPRDNDLNYDLGKRRWVSGTETNYNNRLANLQHDVDAYENISAGLKNESRGNSAAGLAASMGINAAGNALGVPSLAGAANAGITGLRGAANLNLAKRMQYTQNNLSSARQILQQFKQPWEAQQALDPAATPKAVKPVLPVAAPVPGAKVPHIPRMPKAANSEKQSTLNNFMQFGAKVAQSSCSYPSMPNSPTNKKHMTSASPAVLEAGEKSEEIGKPDVTETEHAEAEAKQPEEGVKSALEFGALLGGRGKQPALAPDMTRMQRPQTPAPKQPPAPKASTGLLSQTHPISAQSQTAANNAFQQFGKTWNPMDAGRGIYHQYMSGMQRDGETLGNAYGAARNFIVNNSKGPNMLNMQPPAQNVLGR